MGYEPVGRLSCALCVLAVSFSLETNRAGRLWFGPIRGDRRKTLILEDRITESTDQHRMNLNSRENRITFQLGVGCRSQRRAGIP